MLTNAADEWLRSGKPAMLHGEALFPIPHNRIPSMPLVVERGQGCGIPLRTSSHEGRPPVRILKKFSPGKSPERDDLRRVRSLLPPGPAFRAGCERIILCEKDVGIGDQVYCEADFRHWLEGTVLMPYLSGSAWTVLAEGLRGGGLRLDRAQRLSLCRNLSLVVRTLESRGLAHRDLSHSNVFIDGPDWTSSLIDFDSLYHASLTLPKGTTTGTPGYIAPFAYKDGSVDVAKTWVPFGDRFALAVLNVEFLLLAKDWPYAADGALFTQEDFVARSSETLKQVREALAQEWPKELELFEAAIRSRCYAHCPSPEEWIACCNQARPVLRCSLEAMPVAKPEWFADILRRRRPDRGAADAGRLNTKTAGSSGSGASRKPILTLPPDPWRS